MTQRLTVREVPELTNSRWKLAHKSAAHPDRQLYVASGLQRDTRIYRYMEAQYALAYLETGNFWFSSVSTWTDPYERWWHEQLFAPGSHLAGANAFATCWTRRSRDEPFWRLYEHRCGHLDKHGKALPKGLPAVRLRTTVGRLLDALALAIDAIPAKAFVSPVGYTTEEALRRHARSLTVRPVDVAREAAHSLCFKRRSFIFEKELRVLLVDRMPAGSQRLIPLTPSELIDDVMIAPVIDSEVHRAENLKNELRLRFAGKLRRSLLYRTPKHGPATRL